MIRDPRAMAANHETDTAPKDGLWEMIKVILQALAIAIVVRTFFFQPFNIPSPSMYPTLMVGDYLFVSKLSYGYGKYSFNFALGRQKDPIVTCCPVDFPGRKVLAELPERGDVAVFKLPTDTSVDYIKRVIGLPGDRIQVTDGVLFINGQVVKKERIENYVDSDGRSNREDQPTVPQFLETLPNGVTYRVLDTSPRSDADNTAEYVVPANHYFMMGDNRDNSQDSRYLSEVGFVPIENFVGRADVIFFSIAPQSAVWEIWKWPLNLRWTRFFKLI
jgi:signal peptidase I